MFVTGIVIKSGTSARKAGYPWGEAVREPTSMGASGRQPVGKLLPEAVRVTMYKAQAGKREPGCDKCRR